MNNAAGLTPRWRRWLGTARLLLAQERREAALANAERRRRHLELGAAGLLLACTPWVLYFGWRGLLLPALLSGAGAGLGLALTWSARRGRFGLGALLLFGGVWFTVAAIGLWVDRPVDALPRGVQFMLVPLFLARPVLLAGLRPLWRPLTGFITLLLFVLLCALPDVGEGPPLLSHAERVAGLWASLVGAALLTQNLVRAGAVAARMRQGLALELAQAIAQDQLSLHLQPQCDAAGRLVGLEALLRWPHPELGLLRPAQFVPLAEREGLMVPLGLWVLRRAGELARQWQAHPQLAGVPIALNLSLLQVQDAAARQRLLEQLEALALPPGRLRLELSEPVFAAHPQTLETLLEAAQPLGVGGVLEHFGAGRSALTSLAHLPLQQLKIDRQFVHTLDPSRGDTIAQTVVQLGQRLGLEVVAAGVEDAAQLETLRQLGCTRFQGHWIGMPMSPAALQLWAEAAR